MVFRLDKNIYSSFFSGFGFFLAKGESMEEEEGFDLFAEKSAELHMMFCVAPALDALCGVGGGRPVFLV